MPVRYTSRFRLSPTPASVTSAAVFTRRPMSSVRRHASRRRRKVIREPNTTTRCHSVGSARRPDSPSGRCRRQQSHRRSHSYGGLGARGSAESDQQASVDDSRSRSTVTESVRHNSISCTSSIGSGSNSSSSSRPSSSSRQWTSFLSGDVGRANSITVMALYSKLAITITHYYSQIRTYDPHLFISILSSFVVNFNCTYVVCVNP